jgi:UDP-N-acetyl-2-amino-2-deoxyglucuronate dehydrogenase
MTKERTIRFGIVGCGMISEFQADALTKLAGVEITAFYDRTLAVAEKRVAQFGGAAYSNLDEFLKNPEIDAVSICTPSGLHMEAAIAAARAKKHLIVEKPLEVTTERIDQIIAVCREHGVKLGTMFPRRFSESSNALKNAISAGRFGTIVLADVYIKWYRTQEYYGTSGWRGTYRYDGGGALMNQGIHGIDLLQWLMGGIEKVAAFSATRAHAGIEVEDVAVATLLFRSGALGVVEGTTGSWPGTTLRIEISGTDGSVVMEDEMFASWQFRREVPDDEHIRFRLGKKSDAASGGASSPGAISSEGHRRQFADFVSAIRENRPPSIDGAEGRAAVAIISAIYRSAKEQRAVRVE